jgi:hypothetical protein
VRQLKALRELDAAELARSLQRRHCLALIAQELGFAGWPHAKRVLGEVPRTSDSKPRRGSGAVEVGDAPLSDLGTLMHLEQGGAYCHVWSASYVEASAIRAEHGGYLLPYKRQFFIAEPGYIASLGLDPSHPDWARIGRDWVRQGVLCAHARLTEKVIEARLSAAWSIQ